MSGQVGGTGVPCCVNFSERSRHMLCSDDHGYLSIFTTPSDEDDTRHCAPEDSPARCDSVLDLHFDTGAVFDARWTQSGQRLGIAAGNQRALVFDIEAQRVLHTLKGHTGSVKKLRFLRDSDGTLSTHLLFFYHAIIPQRTPSSISVF